jgi:PadR family transcriptional regulator PadR
MDIESWTTQLRKGLAELVVLRVLHRGEGYGYDIMQRLTPYATLALGESTVYPLLNRLTQEGHLAVRVASSPQGPPRRYYHLTPSGKIRLQTINAYWQTLVKSLEKVEDGLVKTREAT